MASGPGLKAKANGLLKRFNATDRVVKLRQITKSGGNSRLGIGETTTVTDTALDPPPAVSLVEHHMVRVSGSLFQQGDYQFIISGDYTESRLRNSLIVYGDDLMKIIHIEPYAMTGVVVVWRVIARHM
jgi:hypothetical protein